MGETYKSTQIKELRDLYNIEKEEEQSVISLAGNPNTGKSTVFNSLTGLNQHTGNWAGKTVVNAKGEYRYKDKEYILVDLPGTYSLFATSVEEEVARDFICFGNSEVTVVVVDATCLERNLNLVFQIMELTDDIILCINLIDEAKKKKIDINSKGIEKELKIPVVLTAARSNEGIENLKEIIYKVTTKQINSKPNKVKYSDKIEDTIKEISSIIDGKIDEINLRWIALRLLDGNEKLKETIYNLIYEEDREEIREKINNIIKNEDVERIRDEISYDIYKKAEDIKHDYISFEDIDKLKRDRKIDDYITSKIYGIPIMLIILTLVFWITIQGANVPSQIIANFLFSIEDKITEFFVYVNAPKYVHGILVLGLYRTLAWVVSVMLPPMAIFFPLFTILEDLGYLPRVAFNLDHLFKRACAHGKQVLTMCMGFGCNAAGITACRIIESPRERLIAIITNNFVPCNGRFPTLIAISSVFLIASQTKGKGFILALSITGLIVMGVIMTLLISYGLSKTILKGVPTAFTLELPPYRKPQIGRILYTSLIDRTVFVLMRAMIVAAPAGAITWILGNVEINGINIIQHVALFLNPLGNLIGLDGFILMAFILGLPANEIVLPVLLMCYLSTGSMIEFESIESLRQVLIDNHWTLLTAINFMLFSLLHWPCATTIWTIKKETGSLKWTALSVVIPTVIAFLVCFITASICKIVTLL